MSRKKYSSLFNDQVAWRPEITEALIEAGAQVTRADLVLAAGHNGQLESFTYLVGRWKDQNPDGDYQALLIDLAGEAIKSNQTEMVEFLLAQGADFTTVFDRDPDLTLRAYAGHQGTWNKELSELAASLKIDLDDLSDAGETPLTSSLKESGGYIAARPSVLKLLELGADPNQPNVRGETPLFLAMGDGREVHNEQIRRLLEAGADPNRPGPKGVTPLMMAAGLEGTEQIEILLAAGADPLMIDDQGRDALMVAASEARLPRYRNRTPGSNPERVRLLLEAGANPLRRDYNGFSALAHAAVSAADPEGARLLIEAGSRLNLSVGGQTLLGLAARSNPGLGTIKLLRDRGVPLEMESGPEFPIGVMSLLTAREMTAQFFGRIFAEINWQAIRGQRLVTEALKANALLDLSQRVYVAELLGVLPEAAPPEAETVQAGLWPVLTRPKTPVWTRYQELKALIRAGAEVDQPDQTGRTPLIYAAQNYQGEMALAVIKELLRAGADPRARDGLGYTALMYAARFQSKPHLYREIISTLIGGGAELEARDPAGHTALMQVALFEPETYRAREKMEILKTLGADLKTRDDRQATILINMALLRETDTSNQPLFKWIIEQGVDPAAVDIDGYNAAMASALAADGQYSDVFFAAGADPLAVDNRGRNALMHLFRQRPQTRLDDNYRVKEVGREGQVDLKLRDGDGLSLLEQVLFSHASVPAIRELVDRGLGL